MSFRLPRVLFNRYVGLCLTLGLVVYLLAQSIGWAWASWLIFWATTCVFTLGSCVDNRNWMINRNIVINSISLATSGITAVLMIIASTSPTTLGLTERDLRPDRWSNWLIFGVLLAAGFVLISLSNLFTFTERPSRLEQQARDRHPSA